MEPTERPYDVAYIKIINDLNLILTPEEIKLLKVTLRWVYNKGCAAMAIVLEKDDVG